MKPKAPDKSRSQVSHGTQELAHQSRRVVRAPPPIRQRHLIRNQVITLSLNSLPANCDGWKDKSGGVVLARPTCDDRQRAGNRDAKAASARPNSRTAQDQRPLR